MKSFNRALLASAVASSVTLSGVSVANAQNDDQIEELTEYLNYTFQQSSRLSKYSELQNKNPDAKTWKEASEPAIGSAESSSEMSSKKNQTTEEAKAGLDRLLSVSDAVYSSVENDVENNYPMGTTYDILVGTGIAALILALGAVAAHAFGLVSLPF